MPPGTGDVAITVLGMLPLTGIVMVSSPQELAQMVVRKALKMSEKMGTPILGLIENMSYAVCPHCGEKYEIFGPSNGQALADDFQINFLGALPIDPVLAKLADAGQIEDYPGLNQINLGKVIATILQTNN